jgi:hypothetical protein
MYSFLFYVYFLLTLSILLIIIHSLDSSSALDDPLVTFLGGYLMDDPDPIDIVGKSQHHIIGRTNGWRFETLLIRRRNALWYYSPIFPLATMVQLLLHRLARIVRCKN